MKPQKQPELPWILLRRNTSVSDISAHLDSRMGFRHCPQSVGIGRGGTVDWEAKYETYSEAVGGVVRIDLFDRHFGLCTRLAR